MELKEVVAKNLRMYRISKSMTLEQLASRTGFQTQYLSRIEQKSQNLTLDVLGRIAEGLEISPDSLVKNDEITVNDHVSIQNFKQALSLLMSVESQLTVKN